MKNIILISPESWGINYLSKHHYALSLAQSGHRVWFINPPGSSEKLQINEIETNLFVVSYMPILRGKNKMPGFLSRYFHKIEIKKILKTTSKPDIVWSFDPYVFQWLDDFGANIKIYHQVDAMNNDRLIKIIAQQADFVFSTAESILNKLKPFNRNCYKIPHGCHFKDKLYRDFTPGIPGKNKIKACYVGNFYKVLDMDTILILINQNPDVDFIFIGPTEKSNLGSEVLEKTYIEALAKKSNAFLMGPIPAQDLHYYLELMDINFAVYKEKQMNSHKIMGYLYSGKVSLSTPLVEYESSELLLQSKSNEDFPDLFRSVKQNLTHFNSHKKVTERRAYALEHSYDKLLNRIEKIINLPL